jgi:DNA-binding transcriptional regulator GbsR (MarR family)
MDQDIFNLGLSVETISVYLLACGLADVGKPVTTKNLTEIWNGTADSLDQSLRELEERNIIARVLSDGKDRTAYKVKEAHRWKRF